MGRGPGVSPLPAMGRAERPSAQGLIIPELLISHLPLMLTRLGSCESYGWSQTSRKLHVYPFHSQEWSIWTFPCSLTTNINQTRAMGRFQFLRWKSQVSQVLHTVYVIVLVRLQRRFEIDHSWEWKGQVRSEQNHPVCRRLCLIQSGPQCSATIN